jgi:hypothetical protein
VSATGGGTYPLPLSGTGAVAFFVATNGSDSNAGTLAAPFATLGKCQAAMQSSSTIKTCYIRSGTYTSLPSTLPDGSGSVTTALYLTSADDGETWSYYPPDGYDNAILDGGSTVTSPGVVGSQSCSGGIVIGLWIDGGNNITINGLQLQHFLWVGIAVHGGNAFEDIFPLTVGVANGNFIENNVIHETCGNLQTNGNGGSIVVHGQAQNNTATHNVAYNVGGMGIRSGSDSDGNSSTDNISGTTFSYNVVYKTCLIQYDCGAVYSQDGSASSANLRFENNIIWDYGIESYNNVPGGLSRALYSDDGNSNAIWSGNVMWGTGSACQFLHGGGSDTNTGNICDMYQANPTQIVGLQSSVGSNTNVTVNHNINIANSSTCPGQCAYSSANSMTQTVSNNDYWNFGSGGTALIYNAATNCSGQVCDNSASNTNPSFNTCPGGNLNSWGFLLNSNSPVLGGNVSFPAQPAGWATPGFWGPPGYVIPHTGTAPSYRPTC